MLCLRISKSALRFLSNIPSYCRVRAVVPMDIVSVFPTHFYVVLLCAASTQSAFRSFLREYALYASCGFSVFMEGGEITVSLHYHFDLLSMVWFYSLSRTGSYNFSKPCICFLLNLAITHIFRTSSWKAYFILDFVKHYRLPSVLENKNWYILFHIFQGRWWEPTPCLCQWTSQAHHIICSISYQGKNNQNRLTRSTTVEESQAGMQVWYERWVNFMPNMICVIIWVRIFEILNRVNRFFAPSS